MEDLTSAARRAWRRTVPIAIVGFIVGAVVGWFLSGDESGFDRVLSVVGFGCGVGGLAGTFSLLVTTIRFASAVQRPLRGLDPQQSRSLRRSVSTGTPVEPRDSEAARRAEEWARLSSVYQPLALAQFLLLYVGIAGAQIPDLTDRDSFARVIVGLLVVAAVTFAIILARQTRRARRYLAAAAAS